MPWLRQQRRKELSEESKSSLLRERQRERDWEEDGGREGKRGGGRNRERGRDRERGRERGGGVELSLNSSRERERARRCWTSAISHTLHLPRPELSQTLSARFGTADLHVSDILDGAMGGMRGEGGDDGGRGKMGKEQDEVEQELFALTLDPSVVAESPEGVRALARLISNSTLE